MSNKKLSQITVAASTPAATDYLVGVTSGITDNLYAIGALRTPGVNTQTGTTYILLSSDNGNIITLNNTNPITLTTATGLGAGFSCLIVQLGAGQVTVAIGGGTTLNSFSSQINLMGQYAMATLIAPTANAFILGGQIS